MGLQLKTIDYLKKLASGNTDQIKGAEYSPQKVLYDNKIESKAIRRSQTRRGGGFF